MSGDAGGRIPSAYPTVGAALLGVVGAVAVLALGHGLAWAAGSVLLGVALAVVSVVVSVVSTYVSVARKRRE